MKALSPVDAPTLRRPAARPARQPPTVFLHKVTKTYGKRKALDGLSMRIERGAVYGLLGPNGAGKTTAIRVITGLVRANEGTTWLFGRKGVPAEEALRKVGYMPQETALYGELTVWENLDTLRRIYGMTRERFADQAARLLDLVDLEERKDSVVHDLSGGMKRRVSLIAAMLHDPALLILDEPTVGVDPELRADFWDYFHGLRERGITILMTTHYMDEARHCTRVGLIDKGRMIAEDRPEDLVRRHGKRDLEETFLHLARRDAPSD